MKKISSIVIILVSLQTAKAQFNTFVSGPNTHGATTNPITSIGIGNFGPGIPTSSRLHVSNFLLNAPGDPTYNGFLFRTDGRAGVNNMWQLFTGNSTPASTEKLRLYIPASTSNVLMDAFQKNGNIQFQTSGLTRIFIQNNVSGALSGFVGVNNVAPQNHVEITDNIGSPTAPNPNGGTGESGLRFTNLTAASTPFANPGAGVLALDKFGDVVYVKSSASSGGNANLCNSIPVDNVTKYTGGNNLCQTNISDLYPTNNVGVNNIAPNDAFDVGLGVNSNGNIDVNNPVSAYKIADKEMLWNKGSGSNVILGVDAAFNHANNNNCKNTIMGSRAGYMGSGLVAINNENVLIGYEAGFNTSGASATYIGFQAGFTHGGTVTGNTFIGYQSGFKTVGGSNDNTMVGKHSGLNNTSGDQNVFVGNASGMNNSTGNYNSFFGTLSGSTNGTFDFNTCLGGKAGQSGKGNENTFAGYFSGNNGIGNFNVALGSQAMQNAVTGNENTIVGYKANSTSTGSSFNTIIGSQSALNNTTGANNAYVGYHAALNQTTGNNNAYLGYNSGVNTSTGSNNTFVGGSTDATNANSNLLNAAAIGANAKVTNSDQMILGDNKVNVGIGLSADATGPQNKLELDAGINNTLPSPSGSPGLSGLRFRDLHFGNTPSVPNGNVLTVDANGDVILTTASNVSGGAIGNYCNPGPQNPLTGDYEIPLGTNNYYFTGNNIAKDKVSVGYPCGSVLPGRLNALEFVGAPVLFPTYAGHFLNKNIDMIINDETIGVYGESSGIQPFGIDNFNIGGSFYAESARRNYGTKGIASINSAQTIPVTENTGGHFVGQFATSVNRGVYGEGKGGGNNFGVMGFGYQVGPATQTYPSGSNIGIYGQTDPTNPNAFAGFFDGDVNVNGLLTQNFVPVIVSDQSLKRNVKPVENAMDIINKLSPKSYDLYNDNCKQLNFNNAKKQFGLIAQEVEKVFPEIVYDVKVPGQVDKDGTIVNVAKDLKGISYDQLISVLIKGAQEQQTQIDKQQRQIDDLKNLVQSLAVKNTSGEARSINSSSVTLSDKNVIILDQNVPNPFAESTVISYNIPTDFTKAQLIFNTNDGKIIKTIDITQKGQASLTVFANDLSNGLYSYSLIIDGKLFATKKMIKQ